jgi:hypothetical protein
LIKFYRAMKRRKLWPDWALLQFDDVCYGPPVPKKNLDEVDYIILYLILVFLILPNCTHLY